MFTIGRVVVKIAGRDAGKRGVVVDVIDSTYVIIDGQTRRRKVNVKHLEALSDVLEIGKNDDHDTVAAALKSMGHHVRKKKGPKQKQTRPKKTRKVKAPRSAVKDAKEKKKAEPGKPAIEKAEPDPASKKKVQAPKKKTGHKAVKKHVKKTAKK